MTVMNDSYVVLLITIDNNETAFLFCFNFEISKHQDQKNQVCVLITIRYHNYFNLLLRIESILWKG